MCHSIIIEKYLKLKRLILNSALLNTDGIENAWESTGTAFQFFYTMYWYNF
jgi:hypothetical protein